MPRTLTFLLWLISLQGQGQSQLGDIITIRKPNGRTVQTFTKGSPIEFIDPSGRKVAGRIQDIQRDSVFLIQMDVRTLYSQTGAVIIDTVGGWTSAYHYREMVRIKVFHRGGFVRNVLPTALMIGGAGYAVLNIINGAYLDEPITDPENMQTLGIALGVFGVGFAMKKLLPPNNYTKPKHEIIYIAMK
jgi:hypothetical protein